MEINKNNSTRKIFETFNNSLKNWFDLISRKEKYSEYIEKETSSDLWKSLKNEVEELIYELKGYESWEENKEKLQSELNDTIYMLMQLMVKLEKTGAMNWYEDSVKLHKEKIFSRATHLKKCTKISLEFEKKIWKVLKIKKNKKNI